jgi:hypothetical protein
MQMGMGDKKCIQNFGGKTLKRNNLENQEGDGRIILRKF